MRAKPPTQKDIALIHAVILPTWQTAAAIAQHAGVPARTAITILKDKASDWRLDGRKVRVDGHNEIHMFRQRPQAMVMGVMMPVYTEDEAEAVEGSL